MKYVTIHYLNLLILAGLGVESITWPYRYNKQPCMQIPTTKANFAENHLT